MKRVFNATQQTPRPGRIVEDRYIRPFSKNMYSSRCSGVRKDIASGRRKEESGMT